MRILVHVCCAPCFTAVREEIERQSHDFGALFFNPNIHPRSEYRRRLAYFEKFCSDHSVPARVDDYDMAAYFRAVNMREQLPERCRACYALRLGRAAELAAEDGFDAFTTTLLTSPYQNHDELVEVGEAVSRERGIDFYYQDFRPLFRRSRELSKQLMIYRQKYCGCVFSESERFDES